MISVYFKGRWLWIAPVLFLALILASLLTRIFFKDASIAYLADIAYSIAAGLLLLSCIITSVNRIFDKHKDWAEDITAANTLGYGFTAQVLLRFAAIVVTGFALAVFIMFLPVSTARAFLLLPPFVLSVVFFRLIGLWIGIPQISLLPLVLLPVSVFFPVYLLPNPVFVVKGDLLHVSAYIFIYTALYLLVDIKLSYYTWRDICIGRIY